MPEKAKNDILNSDEFKEMLNKEFSAVGLTLYSPKKQM
jgi:thioredoxin-related protein